MSPETTAKIRDVLLGVLIALLAVFYIPFIVGQIPLTAAILILIVILLWLAHKSGDSRAVVILVIMAILFILSALIPGTQFTFPYLNWSV